MKKFLMISVLVALVTTISCGDEEGQKVLLNGTIGGEPYTYNDAKANLNSIDNILDTEMYGEDEEVDACEVFISGTPHLSIQIPNEVGRYQVPADIRVVFEQPGIDNASFDATSGFVEITAINEGIVEGYMQADFDDSNTVEGNFVFDLCN